MAWVRRKIIRTVHFGQSLIVICIRKTKHSYLCQYSLFRISKHHASDRLAVWLCLLHSIEAGAIAP